MSDEKTTTQEIEMPAVTAPVIAVADKTSESGAPVADANRPARRGSRGGANRGGAGRGGAARRPSRRREREAPEFAQKILNIRRVARVMAGGRRFSFSVAIVIGDKQGRVGVGIGKAGDTALAIDKAVKNAKRNMITLKLTETKSIAHEVSAKFGASRVMLMPAAGRGLVAGSAVRSVLDLAGANDVNAKIISRSKNQINNARVTVNALKQLT
ncbi:MAG: 30S ribosomal protein S5 [bacterium]|nr:30S ribosomal protein S5 [bacterium]